MSASGSSLPITVTKRAGQFRCIGGQVEFKWALKWNAIRTVFQLVFQLKTESNINAINQHLTDLVQIPPAQIADEGALKC
ncbi:hypothetical protein, partial [Pseudomonas syringae]